MELKILGINITNENIEQKILEKIDFEELDMDKEYDNCCFVL